MMKDRNCKVVIPGDADDVVNYVKVLRACGADVTVTREIPDAAAYDALVIPGGEDINPARYGQENTGCRVIDDAMDALQFGALQRFVEAKKPVLGICNGMQMINIFFGGDLIQDLPTKETHQRDVTNKTDSLHFVRAMEGSWLRKLYGERFLVNSAHHQGVGRVADDLQVVLRAEDDVVEGLVHPALPIIGLQWHPERLVGDALADARAAGRKEIADGRAVYEAFLGLCRSMK